MKKNLLFFLLIYLSITPKVFGQHLGWAKSFGAGNDDIAYNTTTDALGNIYTTGFFSGTVDFDPGQGSFNMTGPANYNLFLQKLDSAGNFIWAKEVSSDQNYVIGYGVKTDKSGNVYVTGGFAGTADFNPGFGNYILSANAPGAQNIFIEKFDSSGNVIWAKKMSGDGESRGEAIALDSSSNIYITGYFTGTVDFDPGIGLASLITADNGNEKEIFIQKLDSAGDLIWVKQMSTSTAASSGNVGYSIAVDASNNVFTTGTFVGTVDFDPGSGTYNLLSLSTINSSAFILKLDATGNFVWAKSFGGNPYSCGGNSIAIDGMGNALITGYYSGIIDFNPGQSYILTSTGTYDAFVEKLDNSGNFLWVDGFAGSNINSESLGYSIALDALGNSYSTGSFQGTVDFDPSSGLNNLTAVNSSTSGYIIKLNSIGNLVNVNAIGGSGFTIAANNNGTTYTAGMLLGTGNFSPDTPAYNLSSNGGGDFFIVKLVNSVTLDTPSILTVTTTLPGNAAFTDKILWTGNTSQNASPIKICADGSNATKLSFVNNTSLPYGKIRFWIASDPYGNHVDSNGYFTGYTHSNTIPDTISAVLAHPSFMNLPQLYRADSIRVVDTLTGNDLYVLPIQVYRAPVLMVHGLWGSSSSFAALQNEFQMDGLYPASITKSVNYTLASSLGFGFNSGVVPQNIDELISICRSSNFSAGKVNAIGHSMGGILLRQYVQSSQYKNDLNKLITLNTPHSGTQLANLMDFTIKAILIYNGFYTDLGAIDDLQSGSNAITDLNLNCHSPNYASVYCHSVSSTFPQYDNAHSWCSVTPNLITKAEGVLATDYTSLIFNGENNDLVVPVPSQQGGLSGVETSSISNQCHIGSPDNPQVIDTVLSLLDRRPSTSGFSTSGFNPPAIPKSNSSYSSQKTAGTGNVYITSPTLPALFTPGQTINVTVTSDGSINHLMLIEGNYSIGLAFTDTAASSATFTYTIPQNAFGKICITAVGSDANSIVDFDTLTADISMTATLDSIKCYPNEIVVPANALETVTLTGYFSDGVERDLSNVNGINYVIADTNVAQIAGSQILGKLSGLTNLTISYSGASVMIPIVVIPEDTNIHVPTLINSFTFQNLSSKTLCIFPNPTSGGFTVQMPVNTGAQIKFEVFNSIGQSVFVKSEKATSNELSEKIALPNALPGVYYIYAYTSQERYSGKIVITK